MGNKDNRQSLVYQQAQGGEEVIAFLRGENGGRLVENEDPGAAVQGLEDFHPLPLAHREMLDQRVRADIHLIAFGQGPDLGHRRGGVPTKPGKWFDPTMMLSTTDMLSARVKCWWTMPSPAPSAAFGEPGGSGVPSISILPSSAV
jgi:hypothetical protein